MHKIHPALEELAVAIDSLTPLAGNPNQGHVESMRASLRRFGQRKPVTVRAEDRQITAGNTTWLAAKAEGWTELAAVLVEEGEAEAQAWALTDNRTRDLSTYDVENLEAMWAAVAEADAELAASTGWDEESIAALRALEAEEQPAGDAGERERRAANRGAAASSLAERFLVPPFSILDARQGYWQQRKRAWLDLGIVSEVGRPANLLKMSGTVLDAQQPRTPSGSTPASASGNDPQYFYKKREAEAQAGRPLSNDEFEADWWQPDAYVGGTSIFDPVLCELAYRWYSPPAGRVLDPFAGGSVRGIVAAWLGRHYYGIDLRPEQVAANLEQATEILPACPQQPGSVHWHAGDSLAATAELEDRFDMLLSCPPYFDLERYSSDPLDLSAAETYEEFLAGYRTIIAQSAARLHDDRFAVWVVGEIRDKRGQLRGFIPDTIAAFEAAGMALHNDAVLVTQAGSLAIRAARIFAGARRLARSHQYVLVFVKGSPEAAVQACGDVEVPDLLALFGDPLSLEQLEEQQA